MYLFQIKFMGVLTQPRPTAEVVVPNLGGSFFLRAATGETKFSVSGDPVDFMKMVLAWPVAVSAAHEQSK
jgi:hypothetical protein